MNRMAKTGLMSAGMLGVGLAALATSRPDVRAAPAPVVAPAANALRAAVLTSPQDLALPTALAVRDGRLIVIDRFGDRAVRVFATADGRELAAFGRTGDGPGEFRGARSVTFDPVDPSAFWVYDLSLARLTRYGLYRPGGSTDDWRGRILPVRLAATVTSPVWVSPNRLLATGFFAEGRLAVLDAEGSPAGYAGSLPPAERPVPAPVLQHAYQARVAVSPDRRHVAVASRHAGRLELYDAPRGAFLGLADVPLSFEPTYGIVQTKRGPRMASGGDLRFGYIDVAVTDTRIYALFSGRTRADYPGRANFGEVVQVFDWSGELREVLQLDADVLAIAADEGDRTLYAIRHLPVPAVLAYPLGG
ncbi:MAG: BF3164 family lipoprotein [Gemmatimonadota bacterium]